MRSEPRAKGPVETLCAEIDFSFEPQMERSDVFVAFVGKLVDEIEDQHDLLGEIAGHVRGVAAPSEGSAEALGLARLMLGAATDEERMARATELHDACDRLNPDHAYPTDHLIDMVSSCASAIRFGLETPCRSRHAAEAASHVWSRSYGVSRFDRYTPAWKHDWMRRKLIEAIVGLLPQAGAPESNRKDGSSPKSTPLQAQEGSEG